MSDITWTATLVSTPTMTLREYYAGLAMQGIEASGYGKELTPAYVADMATKRADALIAALQEDRDE